MDITVPREALLKPLQAASGVVERKQTLPILSNILLSVKEDQLLLTGTDLEIELVGFVPLKSVKKTGTTTVSARKLFDICRTLPEGVLLNLTLEHNYLVVRAGESCFKLNILPPDEFPSLEESAYPIELTIKQGQLKNLLNKTAFAMGLQDVRHYLNGACLDISQNEIKCVAADGHRLALASLNCESLGNLEARIILPRKSVLELIRLMTHEEGDVKIQIADTRFRASTDEFNFTTKLINAQYPDYNRLIPRGNSTATGDRETLKQALTRAAILSNEKIRGIRVQLETNKVRITANNTDQEQALEDVSLEYTGSPMEIGFNVAYLLDVFSAMSTKLIRCIFAGPNEGVLIESAEDNNSLYVIMPMRL